MGEGVFQDVEQFEARLGLPKGFYTGLLKEDDWSFVIKLSAFLEAGCTHILVVRLGAAELADALAHLDQGNLKFGRITQLQALGAITSEQAGILRLIAGLRNDLVHGISNISFSFDRYVTELTEGKRKGFLKVVGHGVGDEVGNFMGYTQEQFVAKRPKASLWITAAEVVACLYLEIELADVRRQRAVFGAYANQLFGSGKSSPSLPGAK